MKRYLFTVLFSTLLIVGSANAGLWDFYQEQGLELPSVQERAVIAESIGIENYSGTAEQNEPLEDYLRSGLGVFGSNSLPIAGSTYNLAGSGVSGSATTIVLKSLTIVQTGQPILDSDLPDTFYITLEPGNKRKQEIVSCTTIAQGGSSVSLSGCLRGLSPITPYTASTTLQFTHGGGAQVIFSNPPQLLNEFAAKGNTEIIVGGWVFDNHPEATSTLAAPTSSNQYATVLFVNNSVNQGAATSSPTVSGISEQATRIESASSTPFGVLDPHYQNSEHASSTPSATRGSVGPIDIWTLTSGFLNQAWLNFTEAFSFSDFTSASTTLASPLLINNVDLSSWPASATSTALLALTQSPTSTANQLHQHPIYEVSSIFESVDRYVAVDEGASVVTSAGLYNLPGASRTKGIGLLNATSSGVFGDGNVVEFRTVIDARSTNSATPGTGARNHTHHAVVGDLGTGAAPTLTAHHFGFEIVTAGNTISLRATSADGSTQQTTEISTSRADKYSLRAVYDGTSVRYYLNGALVATHSTNVPTTTFGEDALVQFTHTSPGTDDSGDYIEVQYGMFSYKIYE